MKELHDMPEERSGGFYVCTYDKLYSSVCEYLESWDCTALDNAIVASNATTYDDYEKVVCDWFVDNPQPLFCVEEKRISLDLQEYIENGLDEFFYAGPENGLTVAGDRSGFLLRLNSDWNQKQIKHNESKINI